MLISHPRISGEHAPEESRMVSRNTEQREQSSQEKINGFCSECNLHLYSCANAWTQISNTYYTCEHAETFAAVGLVPKEESRAGSKSSELEGCIVQPLKCEKCNAGLGLRCIETPIAKIGYK